MPNIGIYKITNKVNGKSYIGQSVNIMKRWSVHANPKKSPNMVISKAINKYGIKEFTFEVLELCDKKDLNIREVYWVTHYNSYSDGYNSTSGGDARESSSTLIKEDSAKEIQKHLTEAVYSKTDLGEMYGVSEANIRSINTGNSWHNDDINYPIRVGYLPTEEESEAISALGSSNKRIRRKQVCVNCNAPIAAYSKTGKCRKCHTKSTRTQSWPNRYMLIAEVLNQPKYKLAIKYNVSDKTIAKWCKLYNIPKNTWDYKKLIWSAHPDSNREQILRRDLVYPVNI